MDTGFPKKDMRHRKKVEHSDPRDRNTLSRGLVLRARRVSSLQ
jgi:hypothetical protein